MTHLLVRLGPDVVPGIPGLRYPCRGFRTLEKRCNNLDLGDAPFGDRIAEAQSRKGEDGITVDLQFETSLDPAQVSHSCGEKAGPAFRPGLDRKGGG